MGLYCGDGSREIAFGVLVDPTSRLDEATKLELKNRVGQGAVLFGDTPKELTDEEIDVLTTQVD